MDGIPAFSGARGNASTKLHETLRKEAQKYEVFLTMEMPSHHFPLSFISSKEGQIEIGETAQGVEVKNDTIFASSGNMFIEVEERPNVLADWMPSGIDRQDNSWLYLIGNYERALLFSKKQLRKWRDDNNPRIIPNIANTGRGFLLLNVEKGFQNSLILRTFVFKLPEPKPIGKVEGF